MGAQLSNLDSCIPYEPDCDGCLPCEDPWGSKRSHKSKDFFEARADQNQWKEAMERTKQHKMHGFAAPPHGPDASASKFFWHSGQAHSDSAGPQHVDARHHRHEERHHIDRMTTSQDHPRHVDLAYVPLPDCLPSCSCCPVLLRENLKAPRVIHRDGSGREFLAQDEQTNDDANLCRLERTAREAGRASRLMAWEQEHHSNHLDKPVISREMQAALSVLHLDAEVSPTSSHIPSHHQHQQHHDDHHHHQQHHHKGMIPGHDGLGHGGHHNHVRHSHGRTGAAPGSPSGRAAELLYDGTHTAAELMYASEVNRHLVGQGT